jgi:hypothetical protein
MKMKTKIVLHDVYYDVTYPEYLLVRNQYYTNPTSCYAMINFYKTNMKISYLLIKSIDLTFFQNQSSGCRCSTAFFKIYMINKSQKNDYFKTLKGRRVRVILIADK